jgi:peroxiredoxin
MGTPDEAREFCGARAPGLLCLSDPEQHAFRAYGIGQASGSSLLMPSVLVAGFQAALEGQLPGTPVGDPMQMPATFVIAQGGSVRLAYYSRTVADHPANQLLLNVLL